jgi:hypothetical protein
MGLLPDYVWRDRRPAHEKTPWRRSAGRWWIRKILALTPAQAIRIAEPSAELLGSATTGGLWFQKELYGR